MRIGIDPGVGGAIAFLTDALEFIVVHEMPTMAHTGKRRQVNPAELANLLSRTPIQMAYVERVGSMPHQGVASSFNFGMSYGVIQGVLAALGIPMVLITPVTWKKKAGLIGKEKDAARTLAQQLYPQAPLGKKKDIGKADALLIARYGGL